ncbi:hypothetical protein CBR_g84059 [Chara braunii]|uniref:Uncharacterized protein n=1 Tax=Chara braunii TaxID=69332 RepID=A0A388JJS1_CHABU|nr:hypothetical protein CBR_g84059 [Chara braunii]|eukprot:GBG42489.1 hypothetical protein CBR_g84059 [Chara braunii]
MRQRMDHYMVMTGKKVKSLCRKRNVKWERKDKSAWELAKQDTDELTKLMNGDDTLESDPGKDDEDEDGNNDSDKEDDDVTGN